MSNINRPTRESSEDEIWNYISYIEDKLSGYTKNGAVMFMKSLNNKLLTLAEQIEAADIKFDSKDDRLFDRFLQAAKAGKDLTSDMKSFLQEYGEQIKEEEKKNVNLMEDRANRKVK